MEKEYLDIDKTAMLKLAAVLTCQADDKKYGMEILTIFMRTLKSRMMNSGNLATEKRIML